MRTGFTSPGQSAQNARSRVNQNDGKYTIEGKVKPEIITQTPKPKKQVRPRTQCGHHCQWNAEQKAEE